MIDDSRSDLALEDDLELTGDLGLDFVNTIGRSREDAVDVLDDPRRLLEWLRRVDDAALVRLAPRDPPGLRLLTDEARALRAGLVALFRSVVGPERELAPSAAYVIDRTLAAAPARHRLRLDAPGAIETHFMPSGPTTLLTPVALSALRTVAGTAPERLRECAAEDCGRWFVDTSRGGRRRWCSMARCGNRAKAARYRRRRALDG